MYLRFGVARGSRECSLSLHKAFESTGNCKQCIMIQFQQWYMVQKVKMSMPKGINAWYDLNDGRNPASMRQREETGLTIVMNCATEFPPNFCAKKKNDQCSRFISTYLSIYLELSRHFILLSKIFKGVLAQLSLIYLVLSHSNLSYPMVQDSVG